MSNFAENKVYLFGNNIRHMRIIRGLSTEVLAEKAGVSEEEAIAAENDDAIKLSAVSLICLMRAAGLDNDGSIPTYCMTNASPSVDLAEGCFGRSGNGVLFAIRCKDGKRYAVFLHDGKPWEVEVPEYIPHLENIVQKRIFQFAAGNHVDDLVMQFKAAAMAEALKHEGAVK